jgi:multiple sugar transport system substrate-binding protein
MLLIAILITFALVLGVVTTTTAGVDFASSASSKENERVTLTAVLAEPHERWNTLIPNALQILQERHPDISIDINYTVLPYEDSHSIMENMLQKKISVDIISVDQIWLADFAEKGLLSDLTNRTEKWGRLSDWYEANIDGSIYEGKIYGIWAWTDVRGIWYWKDLLNKTGIDPSSLKTWDGYVVSAKKLNEVLRQQGIEGVHLVGAEHSPDMWYPYLWMLEGDLFYLKSGHPSKGVYWFPAFNSSEGVKALNFIRNQTEIADVRPQKTHAWGEEFANRKFAVMIEGSWLPFEFPPDYVSSIKARIGFIPMFPVPDEDTPTSTMMGGWELCIPSISIHKDLAWELITIMLEPEILGPWLEQYGYLPTQIPIGQEVMLATPSSSYPYYEEMVSMISNGKGRPNIQEFPQVAEHVKQALDDVFYGLKEPKQALDDAATRSAKVLGW